MDYLEEAQEFLAMIKECAAPREMTTPVAVQLASACAQVALVERLDALLKRLDALTEFDGGKSLFVTLTK